MSRAEYLRAWREANPEAVAEYNRRRREERAAELAPLERVCVVCGRTFTPARRDARSCSRKCRARLAQVRRTERDRARREAGE